MKKWLVVLTLLLSSLPPFYIDAKAETTIPQVQVKLKNYIGNPTKLTFTVNGDYVIQAGDMPLQPATTYMVTIANNRVTLSNNDTTIADGEQLTIAPKTETTLIQLGKKQYRGTMTFTNEKGVVRPINTVDLETYTAGVVPVESWESWGVETLKAQAVASRTYALNKLERGVKVLEDTTTHQVYGGYFNNMPNSTKAVKETAGLVLTANNKAIEAIFSAANGGMTVSNTDAWGGKTTYPYLITQKDPIEEWAQTTTDLSPTVDAYRKTAKWEFSLRAEQTPYPILPVNDSWWLLTNEVDKKVADAIRSRFLTIGLKDPIKIISIDELQFTNPNQSLRMNNAKLTVTYVKKGAVNFDGTLQKFTQTFDTLRASELRTILDGNKLKGNYIDGQTLTNGVWKITGRGFGHGVGYSQWGGYLHIVVQKKTFAQVLSFYYPTTTLTNKYDGTETPAQPDPEPEQPVNKVSITSSVNAPKRIVSIALTASNDMKGTLQLLSGAKTIAKQNVTLKKGANALTLPYGNTTGKVTVRFIPTNGDVIETNVTIASLPQQTTITSSVYLRTKASWSAPKVKMLKKGTKISIISTVGDWLYVKESSNVGYIPKQYASLTTTKLVVRK